MPEPPSRKRLGVKAPLWLRQTLFILGVLAIPVWLALCSARNLGVASEGGGLPPCAIGVLLIALCLGGVALLGGPPPRR